MRFVPSRAAGVMLLLVCSLAACRPGLGRSNDPCATFEPSDHGPSIPSTLPTELILLDVADNSADGAARIGAALRPHLSAALSRGAYLRLIASGGQGSRLQTSLCLDGRAFLINRNNPGTRRKDVRAGTEVLEEDVKSFVRSVAISPQGSPTRLLQRARPELDQIVPRPGTRKGPATLILWSNLLGRSTPSDCLNVDGTTAEVPSVSALVARCFATGQLTGLPNVSVRLLGVGDGATTQEQGLVANLLASALCARISRTCEGAGT